MLAGGVHHPHRSSEESSPGNLTSPRGKIHQAQEGRSGYWNSDSPMLWHHPPPPFLFTASVLLFGLFFLLNLSHVLCFHSYFVISLSSYCNCLFSFLLSLVFVGGELDAIPRLNVPGEGTPIFTIRGLIGNFATVRRLPNGHFTPPHNSYVCFHCPFSLFSKVKEYFLLHFLLPSPAMYLLTEM